MSRTRATERHVAQVVEEQYASEHVYVIRVVTLVIFSVTILY